MAAFDGRENVRRARTLERRGVTTTGEVLSAHFDPNGGDPNGWTSVHVRFTDLTGRRHIATVGHHDVATEHVGDPFVIAYDPRNPSVADNPADPHYFADPGGLIIVLVFATLGVGVAGLFFYFERRPRKSPSPPGWYDDPHQTATWRFWDSQAWSELTSMMRNRNLPISDGPDHLDGVSVVAIA
jgi:hypothetical protein